MHWWRVKRGVNLANGSTLLGLAVARAGGCRRSSGPRGLVVATDYRVGFPKAAAFTVGNVVISRHALGWLDEHPRMLLHEERHSWQYVACLGLPMLPLYVAAVGYSYLRGGDACVHNVFERLAGLEDGGYPLLSRRERRRLSRAP